MIPEDPVEVSPPKKRKKQKSHEVKKEPTPVLVKEPVVVIQEPMPVIDNPFLKSIKKIPN